MEFKANVHITASTELVGALNKLADAIMGKTLSLAVTEAVGDRKEEPKVIEPVKKDEPVDVIDESPSGKGHISNVEEEPVRLQEAIYSEADLMAWPPEELLHCLKGYGVDPNNFEGKNTNRKLRLLILEAQKGAGRPIVEEPAEESTTEVETTTEEVDPDLEVKTRSLLAAKVQSGKRAEAKALLDEFGCTSVSNIIETNQTAAFFKKLQSL